MTTRTDEAKATILEAAVSRARALSGTEADDVERWVRTYYAHVAPEDLADRTDADLAGAALAHWSLAQQRRPGELKVRVYNPNVEEHGWESPHTVVEFVNDDKPFLVDSISMEITRHGSGIHLMIRPIVSVRRDDEGNLEEIVDEGGIRESTIHVELDKQTDPQALAELRDDLVLRARATSTPRSPTGPRCWRRCARSPRTSRSIRRPSTRRSSPRRSTCSSGCARTSPSSATASTRSPTRTARRCSAPCPGRGSGSCARKGRRRSRPASRGCRPTCGAWPGTSTCST